MDRIFALEPLWQRVWSQRRTVASLCVAATLIGAVAAFVMPPWYRAEVVLLPPSESESGFGLASLMRGISVPGISIPTQGTPADVFLAVLGSRRVNEEIVNHFGLLKLYKKKLLEDAVRELLNRSHFKLTEAGTIIIVVEDRSAKRAADIANMYVTLLDRFNREVRTTKGRRTREFIGTRMVETRVELDKAEQQLADFQSRHKTLALSPERSVAVETAANLYAQRAALQVRLGIVRNYTKSSTDEEVQILQKLTQLDQQLGALPETGLLQARLLRDVKMLEQVYVLLSAQFEEARIDEARNVATVDVLDPASPPERKSRPRRLLMMLGSGLFGAAIGISYALLRRESLSGSTVRSIAAG